MLSATASPAIAPQSPALKRFQYAAHHRPDYDYSPFHKSLDVAFKTFYNKANLTTILLKKGLITYGKSSLLNHATVDVWPSVVFVKLPKWVPCKDSGLFEIAPQYFCRFISKRDFLEAAIEYAMLKGHQGRVHQCRNDATKMVFESSNGNTYQLTPMEQRCECDCPAHKSWVAGFAEDAKIASLLAEHPVLKGQMPDKHVFALWGSWQVDKFEEYQVKRQEWEHRQNLGQQNKETLRRLGVSWRQDIPGHLNIWISKSLVGSVDQRFDLQGKSYWVNQRQISRNNVVPGDRMQYGTAEEAAIALARLCQIISEGDRAKADLFSA